VIIEKGRDCIVLVKGNIITVTASSAMVINNWAGGQGVQWVASDKIDDLKVTFSDGLAAGFLIWGSDETSDRFTSITRQQPHYSYATMVFGGGIIHTSSFEQYTYASRLIPPLVPIVYNPHDSLYFSLRGLWTKEDEWSISGDPRAPNNNKVGVVCQTPVLYGGRSFIGVQHAI
jgi:hypothetical protein